MKIMDMRSALEYLDLPVLDENWYKKAIHYLRGGDGGEHGLLLYGLIRKHRPKKVLDIGTARGFSAMCMAKGLIDNDETDGLVYTLDVIPHDKVYKWHRNGRQPDSDPAKDKMLSREQLIQQFDAPLIERITFLNGDSSELLSHQDWKYGNIDFAYIDGEHDYLNVKEDYENVSRILNAGGIVVFDDYHPGNTRFHIGRYELSKIKFPGVKMVVEEALRNEDCIITALRIKDEYGLAILKDIK